MQAFKWNWNTRLLSVESAHESVCPYLESFFFPVSQFQPPVSNAGVGPREHTVGENWILGPKLPTTFPSSPSNTFPPRPTGLPPPPSQAPPPLPTAHSPPPFTPTQFPHQQLGAQSGHSPALPGLGRPATPISPPHAVPNQAGYSLDEVCTYHRAVLEVFLYWRSKVYCPRNCRQNS